MTTHIQAGKLKLFGTRPNWAVYYIAYTKFHLPKPVFHSPDQIFTRFGERASASFPYWYCMSYLHLPTGKWEHRISTYLMKIILWWLLHCVVFLHSINFMYHVVVISVLSLGSVIVSVCRRWFLIWVITGLIGITPLSDDLEWWPWRRLL